MGGLFLSHASADKPFVLRVAADLIDRGFPVWLDLWEIDLGDSLHATIYDAIDAMAYVLVFVSSNSVNSAWVKKELVAALAKEDQMGRKIVIPVKVDNCSPPASSADRIFADFSGPYLSALEKLAERLEAWGVLDAEVPVAKRLIPVRFRCPFEERDKYLVPQMVIRYIDDNDSPLTWDFANTIMNLA